MSNLEKFNKIISEILKIKNIEDIKDELSPDDIEDWDSLTQVELVNSFEEIFEINLNVVDISRMRTIGDIKKILNKYGVEI